jgi:hypothetical protein
MANESKLVKTILYKSLAEGVYRDVVTKSSSYYYFLGQTLQWDDENNPPAPIDSLSYEHDVRNQIITIKEIKPSDVAFVITKRDWATNVVYDMYDDRYSDEVIGINVISGGDGYINIEDITITISGGGGTGATAVVSEIANGQISGVVLTNSGRGYTTQPTVTVTSSSGTGVNMQAVIGISSTGKQKLEDCNFYVVTDEYNVYKCLDNNNGVLSRYKPSGTQLDPFQTLDGYIWKFMYNIPINLRNKFYTDQYIPVVSALTNHFYSNGTVDNIYITSRGEGYSTALVSVTGDGYREADPIYITSAQVAMPGTAYTDPSIEFSPPFSTASAYSSQANVNLGQIIYNTTTKDFYEVVTPGRLATIAPTHKDGTVINGTAALKYRGTTLKGNVFTRNDQNITAITLSNAGIQYTTPPTVTITDSTGTGASAQAHIGTSHITGITVTNGGNNYSAAPTITLVGGGGGGAIISPTVVSGHITGFTVVSPGSGYTSSPTVVIEDATGTGATATSQISGSPITSITVTNGGQGYTNPTVSITGGGGAGAVAHATVETGVIDHVQLIGGIRDVVIINSGSGYINPPEVTISGGGGQYAVVRSKLYADRVNTTHVVNSGDGYTSVPDVIFGTPWEQGLEVYANDQFSNGTLLYTVVENGFFGHVPPTWTVDGNGDGITAYTSEPWQAATSVTAGETLYYEHSGVKNMYEILSTGYTSTTPPIFTSGTGSSSTYGVGLRYIGKVASLRKDGTCATGTAVLRYGAGYSVTPTATITDTTGSGGEVNFLTTKSEAKISAIVDNGQIVYLVIEDPGVGYTKAKLTVSPEANGGLLTADLSLGAISSQQANNEILTPAGTIDAIAVVSGGFSYGVANISIEGDGTGAAAEAIIDPITNAITKVTITNRGEGYTYANIKVIGNGYAAVLRPIISPFGGHGKNSPEELYARSLMFYTNISNDLNQGVVVANDYRQVGIIKDPRVFDGFERYQGSLGSACFLIQSPINVDRFARDDELYIERVYTPNIEWSPSLQLNQGEFIWIEDRIYTVTVSGIGGSTPPTSTLGSETNGFAVLSYVGSTKSKKAYRIVSFSSDFALVQSIDSDIPASNDVFIKTSNITDKFTAVSVGLPNFDKFSGQMLYIDNKQGFTPSNDETITLRTIVQF